MLAGCFSSRDQSTAPEGECRFPVDEVIPGSTVVVIRRFAFGPAEVSVRPGERVTWINCDEDVAYQHGGRRRLVLAAPGAGRRVHPGRFRRPGEFPYHCEPHPFMTGRVIVE